MTEEYGTSITMSYDVIPCEKRRKYGTSTAMSNDITPCEKCKYCTE